MSDNFNNPKVLSFTPLNAVAYTVVAGAAGWVDTDISASAGINTKRIHYFHAVAAVAVHDMGARPHGSAALPVITGACYGAPMTKTDVNGHVDLLRDAANTTVYYHMGYFE